MATSSLDAISGIYAKKRAYIAYARSFLRQEAAAEDAFHDSMLYLIENIERLNEDNIPAYFSKVLSAKCLDALKKRRRHDQGNDNMRTSLLDKEMENILSERVENGIILRADILERFAQCRKKLPEITIKVFFASRLDGLTHKEIADKYGLSVRRVNTEIGTALKVLRAEFRDYLPFALLVIFSCLPS